MLLLQPHELQTHEFDCEGHTRVAASSFWHYWLLCCLQYTNIHTRSHKHRHCFTVTSPQTDSNIYKLQHLQNGWGTNCIAHNTNDGTWNCLNYTIEYSLLRSLLLHPSQVKQEAVRATELNNKTIDNNAYALLLFELFL